jgi:hypothetical protein
LRYLLFASSLLFASDVLAQALPTQNVEVEPVTCWWRTSTSSVRVGQPFSVILTCSALETEATKAVIDRGRLASAAVQLPPYEVTAGSQADDVTTASRRFMQYEYTVRVISDDVFGADVPIPPLQISYRIESKVQQDGAVQGREQTYVLPPLPVHIASLVPATETHIREAPVSTLSGIAARQSRGALLRTAGTIAFTVAALLFLVALARAVRQGRKASTHERAHLLSDSAILTGVRRELRTVQHQAARDGWNESLTARALAALRVAASYVAGRAVVQRVVRRDAPADGQLVLRRTIGGPVLVSGAATADTIPQSDSSVSDELRTALARFTAARYGRTNGEGADLDDAVATGIRATGQVAAQHTWAAHRVATTKRSINGLKERVWGR